MCVCCEKNQKNTCMTRNVPFKRMNCINKDEEEMEYNQQSEASKQLTHANGMEARKNQLNSHACEMSSPPKMLQFNFT
ncbi:hypothetical protein ACE6H2_021245 [Prunus campanulata]